MICSLRGVVFLSVLGFGCTQESAKPEAPVATRLVVIRTEFVRPDPPVTPRGLSARVTADPGLPILPEIAPDASADKTLPATIALSSVVRLPPRELKLLIPDKTFQKEKGALRVGFDDLDLLKVLNAEPVPIDVVDSLPMWLSGLNGQTVRLRGWMFPPLYESENPGFLFVRDKELCCFGPNVKLYDKVAVSLKPGTTTDHIQGRPFDVVGRFVLKPLVSSHGTLELLYRIVDAEVVERN